MSQGPPDLSAEPPWSPAQPPLVADRQFDAFLTGGVYGVFAVLGLLLGLIGSFHHTWTAGPFPVAAIALDLVTFGVCWLAGWTMRARYAAVVPAVTWLIVVLPLAMQRNEGDLIITGALEGQVFLFGGLIAALTAVVLTRPERPWVLRGIPDHSIGRADLTGR